jgi:hypothetical protein
MASESKFLLSVLSDFRKESELFNLKKALLPARDEKAFLRSTSLEIADFLAPHFYQSGLTSAVVSKVKKSCLNALDPTQDDEGQLRTLIDTLASHGAEQAIQASIVVKLAILWLALEGPGWSSRSRRSGKYVSYCWKSKKEHLPDLYHKMVGRWIDESTTIEQFTSVFNETPLVSVQPIKWNTDLSTEVIYFLKKLYEHGIIGQYEDVLRMDYKQLSACFVKPNGTPFDNLKQAKAYTELGFPKEKGNEIDSLVKGAKQRFDNNLL